MEIMIKHKRISGDHILGQRQVSDSVMFGSKKCSDVLIILDDQTPICGLIQNPAGTICSKDFNPHLLMVEWWISINDESAPIMWMFPGVLFGWMMLNPPWLLPETARHFLKPPWLDFFRWILRTEDRSHDPNRGDRPDAPDVEKENGQYPLVN